MKAKILLLCFLMTSFFSVQAFAQWDDTTSTKGEKTETPAKEKKKKKKKSFPIWEKEDFKFSIHQFGMRDLPFIAADYGTSLKNNNQQSQAFGKTGAGVFKLGSQDISYADNENSILNFERSYVQVGFYNKSMAKYNEQNKVDADLLHLGFGWDDGYGYGSKKTALYLYNSFGGGWSRLKVNGPVPLQGDTALLAIYNNSYRFGIKIEGGLQFQPIPFIALNVNYERHTVYPRVLVWKAGGSVLAEMMVHMALDNFNEKIMSSTPAAAPILNFILQNAVSIGFSELRKENMNFPFGGESPLQISTVKAGIVLNF